MGYVCVCVCVCVCARARQMRWNVFLLSAQLKSALSPVQTFSENCRETFLVITLFEVFTNAADPVRGTSKITSFCVTCRLVGELRTSLPHNTLSRTICVSTFVGTCVGTSTTQRISQNLLCAIFKRHIKNGVHFHARNPRRVTRSNVTNPTNVASVT